MYKLCKYDERNWVIEETKVHEKGRNKGKGYQSIQGYYPSLERAAFKLLELEVKEGADIIQALTEARQAVVEAVHSIALRGSCGHVKEPIVVEP